MAQQIIDNYMTPTQIKDAINNNFTELYEGGGGGSGEYVIEWNGLTDNNAELNFGTWHDLITAINDQKTVVIINTDDAQYNGNDYIFRIIPKDVMYVDLTNPIIINWRLMNSTYTLRIYNDDTFSFS